MVVQKIEYKEYDTPVKAIDCHVGKGYLQGASGSLPDVDIDYQSDRRQEVKEYLERRYNKNGLQRVFSAGTFTTMKLKAVLKDVSRVNNIPVQEVNYITAILDDNLSYTDFFKIAFTKKAIKEFIYKYPTVIEEIRTLMGQPRTASTHASAIIITPEKKDGKVMECFDYLPIKKIDNILVSEIDGYSIDEIGLLKNDCLGIKELTKLQNMQSIIKKEYGVDIDFLDIVNNKLDDKKVYDLFVNGYTQNVFQFSSDGMTKFVMDMKPTQISDLIAANALFRPATIESGMTQSYVDCKNGEKDPVYLWNTYDILKETFGVLCYQENLSQIANKVGGFSLEEGVHLVKYISKKKIDKIMAMKDKFLDGAKKNGCPDEDATEMWSIFEKAGKYLFNKSHATAYALTAYIGAWIKAHYPTAFYTVALQFADDEDIPAIMSEMEVASDCKIVHPDINASGMEFITDYKTNEIYWSLSRIKFIGLETAKYIIEERNEHGNFTSFEDFITRIMERKTIPLTESEERKRFPINVRHIKNLIVSGCFDKIEKVQSVLERYAIIQKMSEVMKYDLSVLEFPPDKIQEHYFWSMFQISISGVGSVDYQRVYRNSKSLSELRNLTYHSLDECKCLNDDSRVVVCASVSEVEDKSYTDKESGEKKSFLKIILQQNNNLMEMIIWNDNYEKFKDIFSIAKGRIIIVSAITRWSNFSNQNTLQAYRSSVVELL